MRLLLRCTAAVFFRLGKRKKKKILHEKLYVTRSLQQLRVFVNWFHGTKCMIQRYETGQYSAWLFDTRIHFSEPVCRVHYYNVDALFFRRWWLVTRVTVHITWNTWTILIEMDGASQPYTTWTEIGILRYGSVCHYFLSNVPRTILGHYEIYILHRLHMEKE